MQELPLRGAVRTSRLWSLLDIVETFNTRELFILLEALKNWVFACDRAREKKEKLTKPTLETVTKILERAATLCDEVEFKNAGLVINNIHLALGFAIANADVDYSSLRSELRNAYDAVFCEYIRQRFITVDPEMKDMVDNETVFGERVRDAFPDAIYDMMEAGNCLAIRCDTAAVFHLMRVAEFGLRALARDRRIQLPKKLPLDLGTWEDILKRLEGAEDAIRNYPKTLAREAQYDFYHGAMMEFKRFKNKFRNVVMHNRYMYDHDEAKSAFNHVKDFMRILAAAISERKRTPVVWKRDWRTYDDRGI